MLVLDHIGGWELIAHTIKQGSTSVVTTDAIDTTGADLLIVCRTQVFATVAPSDSKGNDLGTQFGVNDAVSNLVSPQIREVMHVVENPITGTNHTFTSANVANTFPTLAVAAWKGANVAGGGVVDQTSRNPVAGGLGAVGSIQPGSVTPVEHNELIFTILGDANTDASLSIDSDFIILDQLPLVPGVSFSLATAYKIQGALAAVNPTWTLSPNARVGTCMTTFRAGF